MEKGQENKKILNQAGLSLALMAFAILVSQVAISLICRSLLPEFYESSWYGFTVTAITVIAIGFPVFCFAIGRIPNSERGEIKRLSILQFIGYFFVCAAFMYLANFLGTMINSFIASLKGSEVVNPINEVIFDSNLLLNILYASIVGPIFEELIFRKLLLDKLRRFGELPAILLTGLAFGFFHMNLSQFFYAAVLGFIFAFVTLRTNTVIYSILLHIMVNSIGAILAPLAVKNESLIALLLLALWVYGSLTIGIILFVINYKHIKFAKAEVPVEHKTDYILNPGTILFLLICVIMMLSVIFS